MSARYGLPIERFERQIARSDSCWLWRGLIGGDGYGKFYADGRTMHAHRWYWMHLNGELNRRQLVLHKCDNPLCVNPDHLFIGSDADNMADKVAKQRQARGNRSGQAKLTEEIVLSLRRQHAEKPVIFRHEARKYGVTEVALARAIKGQTFTHV